MEGAFVRFAIREGAAPGTVKDGLRAVRMREGLEFWADDLSYGDVELGDIRGHRQVADTYLVALAQSHGGMLATFDEGLCLRRPRVAFLVPEAGRPAACVHE